MKIQENLVFDLSRKDDSQIIGKTFGKLTAVQVLGYLIYSDRAPTAYEFKCECGGRHVGVAKSVINGSTQSCGCLRKEITAAQGKNNTKPPNSNPAFLRLCNQYKSRAKRAGLEFSLSEEEFKNITSSNCHYCGISPNRSYGEGWKGYSLAYMTNGIDRKNNTIGYKLENALPCCTMCNFAKKDKDYDYFIEWAKRIGSYQLNTITKI